MKLQPLAHLMQAPGMKVQGLTHRVWGSSLRFRDPDLSLGCRETLGLYRLGMDLEGKGLGLLENVNACWSWSGAPKRGFLS